MTSLDKSKFIRLSEVRRQGKYIPTDEYQMQQAEKIRSDHGFVKITEADLDPRFWNYIERPPSPKSSRGIYLVPTRMGFNWEHHENLKDESNVINIQHTWDKQIPVPIIIGWMVPTTSGGLKLHIMDGQHRWTAWKHYKNPDADTTFIPVLLVGPA